MKKILYRSVLPASVVALMLTTVTATAAWAQCDYCSYNLGEHDFWGLTCDEEDSGCWDCTGTPAGHFGCHAYSYEGECSNGHLTCAPHLAAVERQLLDALRLGDLNTLQRTIQASDDITYNVERQAIQVLGCNSGIAVHIPIPSRRIAHLLMTHSGNALVMSEHEPEPEQ